MLSTKIRTILITLVASLGFAVAAAVPAASQAQYHNICSNGHCFEHANYTYGNPCSGGHTAALTSEEAQKKAEEEQKKKEQEESEGKQHLEEIGQFEAGCDNAPPSSSTSGGGGSGSRAGGTVQPVRAIRPTASASRL